MDILELAQRIAELSASAESIDRAVEARTAEGVAALLAAVRGGLKYKPIPASFSTHNCNTCAHAARREYLAERGVFLYQIADQGDHGTFSEGDLIDLEELWLLQDGTIRPAHRRGHYSNWQNEWHGWTRDLGAVLPLGEVDSEALAERLEALLKERLSALGERIQAQQARLAKLRSLGAGS